MTVSMNDAWDETRAFIRAELKLLTPLVLATIYLGNVVISLAAPPYRANPDANGGYGILILLASLIALTGQLALSWLVLRPGSSVGEALRGGATRLGRLILVFLTLGAILFVPLMLVAVLAMAAGYSPSATAAPDTMSPGVAVMFLAVFALMIVIGVRLSLITATLADKALWPVAALREAWGRTRGLFWRLLGMAAVYAVVALIVTRAVTFVTGVLIVAASGGRVTFTGEVILALVAGVFSSALAATATVFLAIVYKRTASGS